MNISFSSAMIVTRASLSALLAVPLAAQTADRLAGKNVSIAQTNYQGRSAVQVIATPEAPNATSYAMVKDVSFRDGTIEVDVAGQPAAGAGGGARGFIGVAFRLQGDGATSTSISDPPMAGPTIKSGGITPPNIVRTRISTSPDRGRKLPKSMSRTLICSPVSGPSTRLRWRAANAALRAWSGATLPHRQRSEARAARGRSRIVGRTWHRGLLFQSEDYGQVVHGKVPNTRREPLPASVYFKPSFCRRLRIRSVRSSGVMLTGFRCAFQRTICPASGDLRVERGRPLQVKAGRILVRLRQREQLHLAERPREEGHVGRRCRCR